MKFKFKNKWYYIDGWLASQLDSLIYNVKDDWDFLIIITGDRTVRVGKSVLAMTVGAYLSYRMMLVKLGTDYTQDDIYFDNKKMLQKVPTKPKYSINHYDEGREGLSSSKFVEQFQKDLLDFFAECGQLNHIFIIVLPDFFDLREEIAVARSECLINVYRHEEKKLVDLYKEGEKKPVVKFKRGFFQFFNRKSKQLLFDIARAKRRKSYYLIKPQFIGRFTNQYPLDETEYRARKRLSLQEFKKRHKERKPARTDIIRDKMIIKKHKEGLTAREISEWFMETYKYKIGRSWIDSMIRKMRKKPNEISALGGV